jgi:tetratricopeptide (TPR) repeat protein
MRSVFILSALALLLWLGPTAAGQTPTQTAPAPLPPEAQQAYDKGLLAAQQQDFLLAIRYFEEARKAVPNNANILFNLGLAESKVPGRELRAIAWFGAYLALQPNAPHAAAVKKQINALDVKRESKVKQLIDSLKGMVRGLLDDPNPYEYSDGYREMARSVVATLYAIAGYDDEAKALIEGSRDKGSQEYAYREIVSSLANAGNLSAANKWLNQLAQLSPAGIDARRKNLLGKEAQITQESEKRKKMGPKDRVEEWTTDLESDFLGSYGDNYPAGLNAPMFKDPGEYLKTLSQGPPRPPAGNTHTYGYWTDYPGDSQQIFYRVVAAVDRITAKQFEVERRIKEQSEQ